MNISLLINMKMPTYVGIFIFVSRENFMLSLFEHENDFITSGQDNQASENSVDQDQTPQNAASDQDLYCSSLTQQFYTHSQVVNWTCSREV